MRTDELIESAPEEQVGGGTTEDTMRNVTDADQDAQLEQVDFSDEEVQISADADEFQLVDSECDAEAQVVESQDFATKTRNQINEEFEALLEANPVQQIRKTVETMKIAFYKSLRVDVESAREEFVAQGGNPDEFIKPVDQTEETFKTLFAKYRNKRDSIIADIEQVKEKNLEAKLKIIEELKELINSDETMNNTFAAFRELSQRWKEIGAVPQARVKDLWETYHLHVEHFYSLIKINNELRDLDLKKNYEIKLKLAEEAEALTLDASATDAFHKLQKLHDEWRETGPVAKEHKELLWERFKEASTAINKRHQEYFDSIKEEQHRNLEMKSELCVKVEELTNAKYASRKDWNKASDELINIQKIWKTIGFAPKRENVKIYERFRALCDAFFAKKRDFYSEAKGEMDANYQAKLDLCMLAESMQESTDWKKTTDEYIALQKQWKQTGSVSRKNSDAIWKRFRMACDTFFNKKSEHFGSVDKQYDENLNAKRALLVEITAFEITDREEGFEAVKNFQRRWSEIGFVPIKLKDKIQEEYKSLIDSLFNKLRGDDKQRKIDRFKDKVHKGGNDRSLRFERERLFNKMKQIEADIQLWENNMGFFAKSKKADALIKDIETKITKAKEDIAILIEKINVIDAKEQ